MKKNIAFFLCCIMLCLPAPKVWAESTTQIINGGFETVSTGAMPDGWRIYTLPVNTVVERTTEDKAGGVSALKISTTEENISKSLAFAFQDVEGVEEGATYTISGMIRNVNAARVYMKLSPCAADGTSLGEINSEHLAESDNTWKPFQFVFEAPKGCEKIQILLRLGSVGTAYFDDVAIEKTKEAPSFQLSTDAIFYYTEWETGKASVSLTKKSMHLCGETVIFGLYDGVTNVAKSFVTINSDGKAEWSFYLSRMEKGKKYVLKAKIGNEERETEVYQYARPRAVGADGVYRKDGKPFVPLFAMDITTVSEMERAAAMGFNMVTVGGWQVDEFLPRARELDVMLLVQLYTYMEPAGSPANTQRTVPIIEKHKEETQIFGWAIMDEPALHPSVCTEEAMINSYKIIRDIDTLHPVTATESLFTDYKKTYRFVDILMPDTYPQGAQNPATYIAEMMQKAEEADGRKPYIFVLQAFSFAGWSPSGMELINMTVQALTMGGSGVGFYRFRHATEEAGQTKDLDETEMGKALRGFLHTAATLLAEDFVIDGGAAEQENVWWDADGKKYFLSRNTDNTTEKTVEIDAPEMNAMRLVWGTVQAEKDGEKFGFTLAPCETVIMESVALKNGEILMTEGEFITENPKETFSVEVIGGGKLWIAAYSKVGMAKELTDLFFIEEKAEFSVADFTGRQMKFFTWNDGTLLPIGKGHVLDFDEQ